MDHLAPRHPHKNAFYTINVIDRSADWGFLKTIQPKSRNKYIKVLYVVEGQVENTKKRCENSYENSNTKDGDGDENNRRTVSHLWLVGRFAVEILKPAAHMKSGPDS